MLSQIARFGRVVVKQNTLTKPVYAYRSFSISADQIREKLNDFQDLFVEARLCLQDTQESLDTVYFEEDLEDSKTAVAAAVALLKNIATPKS